MFSLSFLKSSFARNTLTLISGTIAAQAFSFVCLIIFQRWFFSPEDFGVLSMFTSFSSIFIAASTFKYEYAIVMAKDDPEALNLAALSFLAVLVVAVASLTFLVGFPFLISELPASQLTFFAWAVPLAVIFGGPYEILNYWNNRKGLFGRLSKGRVLQNVATEVNRFAMLPFSLSYKPLILGRVLGQFISVLFLGRYFLRDVRAIKHLISWHDMKRVAKLNRDFPLFTMPTIIITNVTSWSFVYLFFDFYGTSIMGMVSISIQYIALPFGILSAAFSQVFYKKISDMNERAALLTLYRTFSFQFLFLGLLVVCMVFLIPDRLVVWVLGKDWQGITAFMRTAVIWQTIAFAASALSFIYTRLLMQKLMIFYGLLQLALVYASLMIGHHYFESPEATFMLFVICQSLYYVFAIASGYYLIKKSTLFS